VKAETEKQILKQENKNSTTMKTRFNQILLLALVSFFLLAGNVNAEGTERTTASSLETLIEPALELENWMVDEYYWMASDIYGIQYENTLNVEDWMVNDEYWASPVADNQMEEALNVENWMVNAEYWSAPSADYQMETALNVEDWMVNAPFFAVETINSLETELGVESWMVNANFWDLK
jgi:hypothetical protein